MKRNLTLFFLLAIPGLINAQTFLGQSELSVSYGVESFQELSQANILADDEWGGSQIVTTTGSLFFTYRYYVSPRFSVGATVGVDNFNGRSFDEDNNTTRTFSYRYTTIATEFLFNYINKKKFRIYTCLGSGISFYSERNTRYNQNNNPVNTTNIAGNTFAFQYVPAGISYGGRLSAFCDAGIGYKGVLNAGLSYRIGKERKRPFELLSVAPDAVVVVPHNYPVSKKFKEVGEITSGIGRFDKFTDFNRKLDEMEMKAKYNKGNVLRIDHVTDNDKGIYYKIGGTVFYVADPDSLKKYIENKKSKKCDTCSYAKLILYRPSKGHMPIQILNINDTSEVEMYGNDEYIYKIRSEGEYKISGSDNPVHINVQFGKCYYVKVFLDPKVKAVKKKKPFRRVKKVPRLLRPVLMDDIQGELESSVARKIYIKELKRGINSHKIK